MEDYISNSGFQVLTKEEDKERKLKSSGKKDDIQKFQTRSPEQLARQKTMDEERDRKFNKIRNKILGTIKEYENMLGRGVDQEQ